MTQPIEYNYIFRDMSDPNKFYKVRATDFELATLRAFAKFGKNITSFLAQETLDDRNKLGIKVEIIEWRKDETLKTEPATPENKN